jgi:glycerophosphoryl diester phosphodiesterase
MNTRPALYTEIVALLVFSLCVGCTATPATEPDAAPAELVAADSGKKIVIAHRGASGYLPEHTLAAKTMAYAQMADYIEQDLVMTKDNRVIVLHDHHLDQVTNVRDVFPERHRDDGRYYVIDFSLEEIRSLDVYERFDFKDGTALPVFADRFPLGLSRFKVHTFEEEIELIQGLNISTGRTVGLYPEIKSPAFHLEEGKDLSYAVLNILKAYGYVDKSDELYLQCFDWAELKRIHETLQPQMEMDLRLVQLLPSTQDYRWILQDGGMAELASVVDGVGPSIHMIVERDSPADPLRVTPLVAMMHAAKLAVHPYTFRREKDAIPEYASSFDDLLDIFLYQVGVDGVFTDFPDLAVKYIESRKPLDTSQ